MKSKDVDKKFVAISSTSGDVCIDNKGEPIAASTYPSFLRKLFDNNLYIRFYNEYSDQALRSRRSAIYSQFKSIYKYDEKFYLGKGFTFCEVSYKKNTLKEKRNRAEKFLANYHLMDKPAFVDDDWFKSIKNLKWDYPFFSKKFKGKISYFKSKEAFEKHEATAISLPAYISRIKPFVAAKYQDHEAIIELAIKKLQEQLKYQILTKSGDCIFFAKTPEEIDYVYSNGPSSCMSGNKGKKSLQKGKGINEVSFYAGGDLAIAYIRNEKGRISGRVVCWPEKKIYSQKWYGVKGYNLINFLQAFGYKKGEAKDFSGAKFLAMPIFEFVKNAFVYGGRCSYADIKIPEKQNSSDLCKFLFEAENVFHPNRLKILQPYLDPPFSSMTKVILPMKEQKIIEVSGKRAILGVLLYGDDVKKFTQK